MDRSNAFGRSDERDEGDALLGDLVLDEDLDGLDRAAASRQHRVEEEHVSLRDVRR